MIYAQLLVTTGIILLVIGLLRKARGSSGPRRRTLKRRMDDAVYNPKEFREPRWPKH